MAKSPPLPNTSRPRRRSGAGIIFFFVVLLVAGVALAGFAFLAPARLAFVQERTLGVLHGGIAKSDEKTTVECVKSPKNDEPQAVTRTVRTANFRDGTALVTTFSSAPAPTSAKCDSGG